MVDLLRLRMESARTARVMEKFPGLKAINKMLYNKCEQVVKTRVESQKDRRGEGSAHKQGKKEYHV